MANKHGFSGPGASRSLPSQSNSTPARDALRVSPTHLSSREVLRQQAEQLARESRPDVTSLSAGELQQLVDRLRIDQLEWELRARELDDFQDSLLRTHERYFQLYEQAPLAYLTASAAGVIQEANLSAANLLMCKRSFLIGRSVADFVTEDCRRAYRRQWENVLESQLRSSSELWLRRCDGEIFPAQVDIDPPVSEQTGARGDQPIEVRLALVDISPRKRAEAAIARRKEELERRVRERTQAIKTLCDIASLANRAADVETAIQYALQQVCEYNGWCCGHAWLPAADNPRELISGYQWYSDPVAAHTRMHEQLPRMRLRAGECLAGRVYATGETAFTADILGDLSPRKAAMANRMGIHNACAFPVQAGERCVAVLEFFSKHSIETGDELLSTMSSVGTLLGQVIERVQTAETLRRENELCEKIIQTAQMIVLLLDDQGRILRFNPYLERLTGWRLEEMQGQDWFDRFLPESERPPIRRLFATATGGQPTRANVNSILTRDGQKRDIEWFDAPLTSPEGKTIGLVCIGRDVTAQKRNEAILRETAEHTRAILASLPAHIAVLDREGNIVAVNPAWLAFAEANRGQAGRCDVGVNYLDVCRRSQGPSAEEAPQVLQGISDVLAGRLESFAVEYPCHCDRERRWFLLQASPLRDNRGGAVVAHINITARVLAEQRSRASDQRLRAVVDAAPDAILTVDCQGIIRSVNPTGEQMFQYSAQELIGAPLSLLIPNQPLLTGCVSVGDLQGSAPQQVLGGERGYLGRRKDGSMFPLEISLSQVDSLQLFVGMIRDVTERKELERLVIEASTEEQRRIGLDIHDGVGQDLTGLRYMAQTHLESLLAESSPSVATAQRISEWLENVQRQFRSIIRQLVPVEIDTLGLVAALRDLARRTTDAHDLECVFRCRDPVLVASPGLATQVYRIVQEAVRNAVRHAQAHRVVIELREEQGDGEDDVLVAQVADDGVGLQASTAPANGFGMRTMVYRAGLIGARLRIESRQPHGTLVTCTAPLGAAGNRNSGADARK